MLLACGIVLESLEGSWIVGMLMVTGKYKVNLSKFKFKSKDKL